MNLDQILSLVRTLLAAGGPISGLLVMYGMPGDKAALWLSVALIVVPPLVSAVWGVLNKTAANKVATVAAMAPADKATAMATLSLAAQVDMATAIPDKAMVTAAGALSGVNVTVASNASEGAKAAAQDPAVEGVNPI